MNSMGPTVNDAAFMAGVEAKVNALTYLDLPQ
jgi:hypothetical protein